MGRCSITALGTSVAAGVACTSPTGNDWSESWESATDSTTGTDVTWTKSGTGTLEVVDSPGTFGNDLACAKSFHFVASGSGTYVQHDRGSTYDLDAGNGYQIVSFVNVHAVTLGSGGENTLIGIYASSAGSNKVHSLNVYNASGTYKLRIYSGSGTPSAQTTIALDTWYKVTILLAVTATDSSLVVCDYNGANCGAEAKSTRYAARDYRYIILGGPSVTSGEVLDAYVGFVYGNAL